MNPPRPARIGLVVRLVAAAVLLTLIGVLPGSARDRAVRPADGGQPDIVVLVVDDVPQMDDRIWERLPTIRELFIEQGMRFTDHIGNDPLCCPGRANLLTGQWSSHHRVTRNDARLFDPRVSIATELQGVGYWTGIFGKYFNQTNLLRDRSPRGWDRSFIFGGGYFDYAAWADGKPVRLGPATSAYSTTQIQRRAIAALRAIPYGLMPRFLWLAPYAVHGGLDESGVKRYWSVPHPADRGAPACADIAPWKTAATREWDRSDKPAYIQAASPRSANDLTTRCESLLSVDRMLAAVLAELRAEGRADPLVILTADNGMAWGAHGWVAKVAPYTTPIPLFIHWPDVLGTSPRAVSSTVTNVDIAPTLCAVAGCVMGPFPNGDGVDGRNLLPLILGRSTTLGREVIFEEHTSPSNGVPQWHGVRTTDEAPIGRWVYTEYETGERELYDLSGGPCWTWQNGDPGDPCQLVNLAGDPAYATVQARLATTLAARESHPKRVLRSPR